MVRSAEEAAKLAENTFNNKPGTCQLWTRTMLDAPSAGDRDGDGDADAVDGWKSEPTSAKHKDRNPPRGMPVAFSGGSRGFGHRAISLGDGKIRSTDMVGDRYVPGKVGTTTIAALERAMGITYLGWSETITGLTIPVDKPKPPVEQPEPDAEPVTDPLTGDRDKTKHSWRVARAIKLLESEQRNAKLPSKYRDFVRAAVTQVKKIPFTK
jgi:hypothetical protein